MVRFDFRPIDLITPPRPKTRKLFLLLFFLFMMFVSSVGYAVFTAVKEIISVRADVIELTNSVDNLEGVKINLIAEVERMKKQEAAYASGLSVMSNELPTIEILGAIDRSLPAGITLNTIKIDAKLVSLAGVAASEEIIVEATRNLLNSGAFSTAQVPIATRGATERDGIRFTLTLTPLPIGEVKI